MTRIFDACDVICGTSDSLTAISNSNPTPPSLIILLRASSDDIERLRSNADAQNCSSVLSDLSRFNIIFMHPFSIALLCNDSDERRRQGQFSKYQTEESKSYLHQGHSNMAPNLFNSIQYKFFNMLTSLNRKDENGSVNFWKT